MAPGPEDVEAIERATFDAVPPQARELLDGWLLGFDSGPVGRAHSAVPLRHDLVDGASVERVVAKYRSRGLPPVFRMPELPAFDGIREQLRSHGYSGGTPTRVCVAAVNGMPETVASMPVDLMAQPDESWGSVFLGDGVDPADCARRVAILGRAQHALFACIRMDGRTVASGMGSFSQGWASVHGMRTLPGYRGRGMAGAILQIIAKEAKSRGLGRAFLQVEAGNTGAQALYSRFGFAPAWDYAYWYPGSA